MRVRACVCVRVRVYVCEHVSRGLMISHFGCVLQEVVTKPDTADDDLQQSPFSSIVHQVQQTLPGIDEMMSLSTLMRCAHPEIICFFYLD